MYTKQTGVGGTAQSQLEHGANVGGHSEGPLLTTGGDLAVEGIGSPTSP